MKYQKPLLPITCGNLGTDAQSVEQALIDNFQLAQAWDAIVLLDEADVFLSRRDKSNLERNALVSVFLRTLEYYTGILFLTTNRVGAFDGAFISRVHTALYYPALQLDQSLKIWKNNLNRSSRQKGLDGNLIDLEDRGVAIMKFAELHFQQRRGPGKGRDDQVWNGRQIRNAFQTAVALAHYDVRQAKGEPKPRARLEAKHFETVARASAEFERYLAETRNDMSEAELAGADGERADGFVAATHLEESQLELQSNQPSAPSTYATSTVHPTAGYHAAEHGAGLIRRPTLNSRLQQYQPTRAPMMVASNQDFVHHQHMAQAPQPTYGPRSALLQSYGHVYTPPQSEQAPPPQYQQQPLHHHPNERPPYAAPAHFPTQQAYSGAQQHYGAQHAPPDQQTGQNIGVHHQVPG